MAWFQTLKLKVLRVVCDVWFGKVPTRPAMLSRNFHEQSHRTHVQLLVCEHFHLRFQPLPYHALIAVQHVGMSALSSLELVHMNRQTNTKTLCYFVSVP